MIGPEDNFLARFLLFSWIRESNALYSLGKKITKGAAHETQQQHERLHFLTAPLDVFDGDIHSINLYTRYI